MSFRWLLQDYFDPGCRPTGRGETMRTLKAANVITKGMLRARVFCSGKLDKAVTLKGIAVTRGAREAIEAAGGKVED